MGDRGRPSREDMAAQPLARQERPYPPADLLQDQRAVWQRIVDAYPSDHFDAGALPVLADYCCAIVSQQYMNQRIAQYEREGDVDSKEYLQLLRLRDQASRTKLSLARGLGMAEKSVYEPKRKRGQTQDAPWEFES